MHHRPEATVLKAAADQLRAREIPTAVLNVAATPLTDVDDTRRWLAAVARHVDRGAPCCQGGADRCAYARHALPAARRILAAAGYASAG